MSPATALRALSRSRPAGTSPRGEERELVRRAAGDPEAFAALYRAHYPAIQRYLRRRLGDPHVVEDAAAETFLAALQSIGRYRDRGLPFRAWLYRLATSRANRHARRAARLVVESLEREPMEESDAGERRHDEARLALLRVAPRFQAVLSLHYFEGLSVEEIGRALSCRPGTVKSRLARGRDALRRELRALGWEGDPRRDG